MVDVHSPRGADRGNGRNDSPTGFGSSRLQDTPAFVTTCTSLSSQHEAWVGVSLLTFIHVGR